MLSLKVRSIIIKNTFKNNNYAMETATILSIFISTLLLGITGYSIYTAFGPTAKDLRDPFEEHEGAVRLESY